MPQAPQWHDASGAVSLFWHTHVYATLVRFSFRTQNRYNSLTQFHLLRHVTRHAFLSRLSYSSARHPRHNERDTLVTTGATGETRMMRIQWRRHSVDWGGDVQLTFPEIVPEINAED